MFEEQGVAPESPTGTDPSVVADPSSAGTQNTEQPQGQVVTDSRGNVIPPWRVNEMVQQASERAVAQAEARFAQERQQLLQSFDQRSQAQQQAIMQALQQKASAPAFTPEQAKEREQARTMLHELEPAIKAVPELAREWKAIREELDQMREAQGRSQLVQERAQENAETARLYQMASQAGLPVSPPQQFQMLCDMVKRAVWSSPQLHQAFREGDQRALPAAFEIARKQIDAERQYARASVATTKTNLTRTVPPRIGGSQPGVTPIPKYDPKDHRGSMAKIHAGAAAAWEQMTG